MVRPRSRIVVTSVLLVTALIAGLIVAQRAARKADPPIGRLPDGTVVAPTAQVLRPAGESVDIPGRPRDMALSPDGRFLYVKNLNKRQQMSLVVVDVGRRSVVQTLEDPKQQHSYHGIALSADGGRLYTTVDEGEVREASVSPDGRVAWTRRLRLKPRPDNTYPGPGGLVLDEAGKLAYVCVSRRNCLAVIDLEKGAEVASIPVGVAPYAVVLDAGTGRAYVTNWGGDPPKPGALKGDAQGIDTLVDERGIASSGSVSIVDLGTRKEAGRIRTGLHPTEMAHDSPRGLLYVANANEDTVSVIDLRGRKVIEEIHVRLSPEQPFGSAPNALALSPDGGRLFVANGGNNALAVIQLGQGNRRGNEASRVQGFIPTAWYPADVLLHKDKLYVANLKGWGSLDTPKGQKAFHVRDVLGTVTMVGVPDDQTLDGFTRRVRLDSNLPQALRGLERAAAGGSPVPLPERTGQPSVFQHVVYVIKENRTYDQVLGDLSQGNGDDSLCIFPRSVTPNHHALAEEYVLLDNFFCNSLYSADGHAWITEANTSDYMEKSRSNLVWGNNPLSYSSPGFLWTHALNQGLTFQNFGEYDYADHKPEKVPFADLYRGWLAGKLPVVLTQNVGIPALRPYTVKDFPGWNMNIPDVIRADVFLRELRKHEQAGTFPNLTILYLPNDHTSGTREGMPTPRAYLAQNDDALGRCVEAITRSRFWPKTCIFVLEDDPQDGFDHVDGHRSIAYVISPYTRRGAVVSTRYNQTGMLRSIELILGIPPMTQFDAMAKPMWDVFQPQPDLTPYKAKPPQVPLEDYNPPRKALRGQALHWAEKSHAMNFEDVDSADEDTLNRILWHAARGVDAPYPVEFTNDGRKAMPARKE